MRLTFLGTSAGEGYPGFWCTCPNCAYAREHGGRNLRGNCCALVDDDLLLDMNDHFFVMAVRLGLPLERIRHLLVTHPHVDHFTPWKLAQRAMPFAHLPQEAREKEISPCFTELPTLHVYGNAFVQEAMERVPDLMDHAALNQMAFHLVTAGVQFHAGDAEVTPLRSIHGPAHGFTYNYIIHRDGKTLLYATDTGGYDEEMLEILRAHRYDCVVLEGTFGLGKTIERHMSLEKNRAFLRFLNEHALWTGGANLHLTHICPHWSPPHDQYVHVVEQEGMSLAYDGKVLTF